MPRLDGEKRLGRNPVCVEMICECANCNLVVILMPDSMLVRQIGKAAAIALLMDKPMP